MTSIMGGETEYAVSARSVNGPPIDQGRLLHRCWEHARATLGYTSASTRGRFLQNGGLIYLDAGLHLEWSTPETTSPFEVVRYLAAGDRILSDIVARFAAANDDIASTFCSRVNVDQVSKTLWAAHESYRIGVPPAALKPDLLPFLASRVILGAGGWNVTSPALAFTMSPRAHFLDRLADYDSQHRRPLFHIKDESLARDSHHRLHVTCGESLSSERANILRFGTTALVAALAERRWSDGASLAFVLPIRAAQQFAGDPTCRARARLQTGGHISAIDVQRHFLVRAEGRLSELNVPWAEEVCALWRETLDDLEAGGGLAGRTLDWAIKRRVFDQHLVSRGLTWATLAAWESVLRRLEIRWQTRADAPGQFDMDKLLNPDRWLRTEMDDLTPKLERADVGWADLEGLATVRDELFEIDARFAALGDDGIFNTLHRAGVLDHVVRPLDVSDAVVNPPSDTRAAVRGAVVRRLSDAGVRYGAEWSAVYDYDGRRQLLLDDPFVQNERWVDVAESPDAFRSFSQA